MALCDCFGISFSEFLWVTKRNLAVAVEDVRKHLDSLLDTFSAAKRQLIQRIQNVDDKIEIQNEILKKIQESVKHLTQSIRNLEDKRKTKEGISKHIQESVEEAYINPSNIEYDLDELQSVISDGSSQGKPDPAGIGGVLRDHIGKELIRFSKAIGVKDSNMAELLAIREALIVFISSPWVYSKGLIIESDSKVATNWVLNPAAAAAAWKHVIDKLAAYVRNRWLINGFCEDEVLWLLVLT
ncbi:hypothetical protein PTKIN_Ptkin02bG0006400 [Pterospermum kingtungense]